VVVLRLSIALFLVQAGFHAWTASLPLALARGGAPEATIGLVMGLAAVVSIPGALAGGRLLDTFGGSRMFLVAGLAYLAAAVLLLVAGDDPASSSTLVAAARVLQGIGIGVAMSSALSLVPRLVEPVHQAAALSYVSAAQNVALMVMPFISIAVLDATSFQGVGVLVLALVGIGLALSRALPLRPVQAAADAGMAVAKRRWGIAYRRTWTVALLIVVLFVAHWGVITAYLPVRAEEAGANIGLFFFADGIAIVLTRLAAGRLVEHISLRLLILIGAGATAVGVALLLLPVTSLVLLLSGLLGGAGGAVVMTPVTIELSRRSSDADRGSAFALYSGGLAVAMTLGSIGGAPIVAALGLNAALVVGIALIVAAMVLAALDGPLGEPVLTPASTTIAPAQVP
jgi:DHA1 family bicyclomycin/chloramphenicol resistance-like MFS transporter